MNNFWLRPMGEARDRAVSISVAGASFTLFGIQGSLVNALYAVPTAAIALGILYLASVLYTKLRVEMPKLRLQIVKLTKRSVLHCPIAGPDEESCPLEIEGAYKRMEETLASILDTEKEFHFVGFGSENIFFTIHESPELANFQRKVDSRLDDPIQFHFVILNPLNRLLMLEQQALRYPKTQPRPMRPIHEQISNAINFHNRFCAKNWNLTTYLSDSLATFRVVIVDDVAYLSFNVRDHSAKLVPQLRIRQKNSPFNLYG